MQYWAVLLCVISATVPIPPASASGDTLLAAISFALSGKDGVNFRWIDRANCIVGKVDKSPDNEWDWKYYLNIIDPSRTTIVDMNPTYINPSGSVVIEVRGEALIYEMHGSLTEAGRIKGRYPPPPIGGVLN